jgi:tetratricopeptide (TPR) repeat protein
MAQHPDDARLYRHRGHRYITVRRFDDAIADLSRAADLVRGTPDEIEEDGAPNEYNIPTSRLQSNIFYHLALAHYLKGDFESALPVWRECMTVSTNDDMMVATSDWLYMTLRRLGRDAEAEQVLEPINSSQRILENTAYHRRLLMYRGEIPPDSLLNVQSADPVQLATYASPLRLQPSAFGRVEGPSDAARLGGLRTPGKLRPGGLPPRRGGDRTTQLC